VGGVGRRSLAVAGGRLKLACGPESLRRGDEDQRRKRHITAGAWLAYSGCLVALTPVSSTIMSAILSLSAGIAARVAEGALIQSAFRRHGFSPYRYALRN